MLVQQGHVRKLQPRRGPGEYVRKALDLVGLAGWRKVAFDWAGQSGSTALTQYGDGAVVAVADRDLCAVIPRMIRKPEAC